MSGTEYIIELSEEAHDDLINIQNYTYATYGEKKWQEYGTDLDKAMQHICYHPFSGHVREDTPPQYKSWIVNEHVILYRIEKTTIYIVRVLHRKMDFRYQFL